MKASRKKSIAIVGGGASGFFAALRCAEVAKAEKIVADIRVFESSTKFLTKLRISGGGRCNVTHHLFEVRDFCSNYPRGQKELLSPFQVFQASNTVEWFQKRGVELKHESDGRMFPITDRSETIIDCFLNEAKKHNVRLLTKKSVKSLKKLDDGRISLFINDNESFLADSILIATGSFPSSYKLAKNLGHTVTELAPSLFTFKIKDIILG